MFNKHMSFLYTVQIVHPGLIVNVWKIKFIEITNALNLAQKFITMKVLRYERKISNCNVN